MVNRRNFIAGAAGCAGFMSIMRPLELMAIELPTPQRIFFINLFGGCDALSIFNPYGNAGLQAMRPTAWIQSS